jgi:dipeptidyl aminopeptidase/acylaminoacyl peptidase
MRRILFSLLLVIPVSAELAYQKPSKEILDILNAPAPPALGVNPTRTYATLSQSERYPSIAEVSQPMLRLAGMRINPRTNGLHLAPSSFAIMLVRLTDGVKIPVSLPPNARAGSLRWSDDGKQFAFANSTATGIELWIGDATTGKTRNIDGVKLNAVLGDPIDWLPDNRTLLVKAIPSGRGPAPVEATVPIGPSVQESLGKAGPVPTYEDMLKNPHDEDLYEYYATAQLARVDAATGAITRLGQPGLLETVTPSPDGMNILVTREHRPFSYLHPAHEFPKEVEIWNPSGTLVYKVASLPLPARVPLGGVESGPRQFRWIANQPASLMWVEALDGGNPKEKVPHRDRLLAIKAPFKGEPVEIFKTEQRFSGIEFGKNFALVEDYDRNTRILRTLEIDPSKPSPDAKLVWSRNQQDRYKDPGRPVERRSLGGRGGAFGFPGAGGGAESMLVQSGDSILLIGQGASPQGDRPFLDRYNIATGQSERLFHSAATNYETVDAVLDDQGTRFITRRESPTQPPNFYLHNGASEKALTDFKDPAPQLRRIKKQLVTYQRPDGVPLSFNLYLPPDYKPGTRLPAVLWAYPREFNDADTAGQVSGSLQRFTTITGYSELFFLLEGYAVLDDAAMPVVGTPETVNNTYVEQIVADAKAAIDKAAEMGVVDPDRVGVGGHSYGAFMTANLLTHSNLFRAGIAESGAYNRTLTPFGFQTERRSFWEAQDIYLKMSPFLLADKIKVPVLLIHGEADDNTGTFPIQSERMYEAIRGNGGIVRLVFLPDEAHGYRAKETIEHVLWEKSRWFDKYVKNAGPSNPRTE